MLDTDVLILGGGLSGLSTAYHLQKFDKSLRVLVVEKKSRVGGLAGSLVQDGFTFDYTGHLLHLHDPHGKAFILDLLRGNIRVMERSAWIHSHRTFTRYPFQANTFGLPKEVVEDCVLGFLKAARKDLPFKNRAEGRYLSLNALGTSGRSCGTGRLRRGLRAKGIESFTDWTLKTFGEGIARHFMFPYNEKLWRVPLDRLTTEWVAPFVPRPKIEEVLYGALTDQKKSFGYNATFRYPFRGGIQALPDALAQRVGSSIELGCPVQRVAFKEKCLEAANLGALRYKKLVNTLPLAEFLGLMEGPPAWLEESRQALSWTTVHCLNIGIRRAGISDKHWIYFPEKEYPFYRAGFSSNFSPHIAPEGTSSLYVEFSTRPGERFDFKTMESKALAGLKRCGLLRTSDRLATRLWMTIPVAYVTYDRHRSKALPAIFAWLKGQGIESIGRFGAWKYSFMEEAILDGKRCAERLLGIASTEELRLSPQEELKALK